MRITFLGDIMLDNAMAKDMSLYMKNGQYDFSDMFCNVKTLLEESDFVVANLETPISYNNSDLTNVQWQFCSPREFAVAVKNMGVDFVTTANNHCLDRGIDGLENTIRVLDEIELAHTGTHKRGRKREHSIVDVCGIRFGILSYTYGTNAKTNYQYLGKKNRRLVDLTQEQEGYIDNITLIEKISKVLGYSRSVQLCKWIEQKLYPDNSGKQWFEKRTVSLYRKRLLKKDIKSLKRKTDYTIVCLHSGGQYNYNPSEYTKGLAAFCIKHGVDYTIINHEHVVHPHAFLKDNRQFIAYALGNFIGSAGVFHEPYDRQSNYSIALNLNFCEDTKDLHSITFSILKTVEKDNRIVVYPVYDLLRENNDKNDKIKKEALLISKVFSGFQYDDIEEEFILYEQLHKT